MSVGTRIRNARIHRNVTQKDLGIAIGFKEESADVRIAQYETNNRTPKEDVINKIASYLDVNPLALQEPKINNDLFKDVNGIMFTLFTLDETNELEMFEYDDGNTDDPFEHCGIVLKHWPWQNLLFEMKKRKEELANGDITLREFNEWKLNYPFTSDDYENQKTKKLGA